MSEHASQPWDWIPEVHPKAWDWSAILTNAGSAATVVGTVFAIFLAWRLWFPARRLARVRRKYLRLDAVLGSSVSRRQHRGRVDSILAGAEKDVTHELTWLARMTGGGKRTTLLDLLAPEAFSQLSDRYAQVAARMSRANALDPSRPLMGEMATFHQDVANELAAIANSEQIPGSESYFPLNANVGATCKVVRLPKKNLVLEIVAYPGAVRGHAVFDCVALVHENESTRSLSPPTEPKEGHLFDGVLPALNSMQFQKDSRTGRVRLALSLTPVRYSEVERDHFFANKQHDEVQAAVDQRSRQRSSRVRSDDLDHRATGTNVGLLTCSFMPVTSDGFILLTERGRSAGAHAGDFGPAVTGNLDLAPRNGRWVDRSPTGCPDLRLAIQREAREELGLEVPLDAIFINALARFTSTSEINSNVLCATAMLDLTLREVATGVRNADLGEGRWEVGEQLLGLKLPVGPRQTTDEGKAFGAQVRRLMTWLLTTADLPPHVAVNGWATLATVLSEPEVFSDHLAAVVTDELAVTDRAATSNADFIQRVRFDEAWT